jgi:hypothetical protein
MAWQVAELNLPATANTAGEAVGATVSAAGADIAATQARIASLTPTTFTANSLAAGAAAVVAARASFDALVNAAGTVVVVHPFIDSLNDGTTTSRALAFPNAIKALASKFSDPQEPNRPVFSGTMAALCFAVSASSPKGFSDALHTFNQVLPFVEFMMVERKTNALINLEKDKWILRSPAAEPLMLSRDYRGMAFVNDINQGISEMLGFAEAYNLENTSPLDELSALADEKAARATELAAQFSALQSQFTGGPCLGLYVTGSSAGEIKTNLLAATGGYGYEKVFTAVAMFIAPVASVQILKELLGL